MLVFKVCGIIDGYKDGGRGDFKGQKEKNIGIGFYKQDWLLNMGGGFREICFLCRKNGRIFG